MRRCDPAIRRPVLNDGSNCRDRQGDARQIGLVRPVSTRRCPQFRVAGDSRRCKSEAARSDAGTAIGLRPVRARRSNPQPARRRNCLSERHPESPPPRPAFLGESTSGPIAGADFERDRTLYVGQRHNRSSGGLYRPSASESTPTSAVGRRSTPSPEFRGLVGTPMGSTCIDSRTPSLLKRALVTAPARPMTVAATSAVH